MITEVTRIIKLFNSKTAWESVALHLLTVILPLMLQKPSANSKKKDHTRYLQKRLTLWKEGRIMEIISELYCLWNVYIGDITCGIFQPVVSAMMGIHAALTKNRFNVSRFMNSERHFYYGAF